MSGGAAPLFRFHVASGARVALRASVPVVGIFVVAVGMSPYPGATLAQFAKLAASDPTDITFVIATAAVAFGLAAWASPRVATGSDGWIRSLPASARTRRRALAGGLATALGPLPLALAGALFGAGIYEHEWNVARFASLVPLTLGAAYAVLPFRRRFLASPMAALGAVIAIAGGWSYVLAGAVLVAAADAVGGPTAAPRRKTRRRPARATQLPWRIALRAAGSGIPGAWAAAGVPLLAGALFIANNDLPAPLEAKGARLAVAFAMVACLATTADRLALHRPPWPWARSLPWTSKRRVTDDAIVLGAVAVPVLIVGTLIDPPSGLAALLALPLAAIRAASAMRRGGESRTAASGAILGEGALASMVFALMPWLVLLAAAWTPFALRAAAKREASLKVSRWTSLHHLASGDPASWRGR